VTIRVTLIREATRPARWKHAGSTENPADQASRDLKIKNLGRGETWVEGPNSLMNEEGDWPVPPAQRGEGPLDDPEIKGTTLVITVAAEDQMEPIERLNDRYSDWHKLKESVAWFLRLKMNLKKTKDKEKKPSRTIDQTERDLEKQGSRFEKRMEKCRAVTTEEEQSENDLIRGRRQEGKLERLLAKDHVPPEAFEIRLLRGHQLPVTCLVVYPDDKYILPDSKDCSIITWDVSGEKGPHPIHGGHKGTEDRHRGHIPSTSISSNGKHLATGDRSKLISIWSPAICQQHYPFKRHEGAASGLSFRKGTHQSYGAPHDRSVKVRDDDQNGYVETPFGHQVATTGPNSSSRERCITAESRDQSVRAWKTVEEARPIFRGHESSSDCTQPINEDYMISGANDDSLALWAVTKKKLLVTVRTAHGIRGDSGTQQTNGIASVTTLLNSLLVASGSRDSKNKLWRCGKG